MKSTSVVVAALTQLVCVAGLAQASITQYSSRPAFEAAAGTVLVQDFESIAPAEDAFLGTPLDFGAFSAFNTANSGLLGGDIRASGLINGSNEITGSVSLAGALFRLTFDAPIMALGFDANNIADQRFDTFSFDNAAADVLPVHDPIDQTRFWGFISDTPFTTFTIRQTGFGAGGGNTDGFRIDDVTYTPAPAAAIPLLLAFAARSRRREV